MIYCACTLCTYVGNLVAFHEKCTNSIRHVKCQYLFLPGSKHNKSCPVCCTYRSNYLRSSLSRLNKSGKENSEPCDPSSHTNYRFLNSDQKDQRLRQLHTELRAKTRALKSSKKTAKEMFVRECVQLDPTISNDLLSIMKKCSTTALSTCKEDSFQSLFWKQQLKAASLSNPKSMHWHPLVIKWCLYLQYRSSGAYEALRSSGVIKLPSGRTLRDYKHFVPAIVGFSDTYDKQLIELSAKTSVLGKNVAILVDEMYIKEGLVFDKHSGCLTGFVNMGDVATHLADYEQQLKNGTEIKPKRQLAKTIVVLMVKGLLANYQFPYATFTATSLKGCDIFPMVWEAIDRLTRIDFRVLVITCDGASCNRKLFSMHGTGSQLTYKTTNVFSKECHSIFFICDPPHLVKTIRNCIANKNRNLWVIIIFLYALSSVK